MTFKLTSNPLVKEKFDKYPESIKPKIEKLRQMVFDAVNEIDGVKVLDETLKWGEPSYLVKGGSTLRMDWKEKTPDQYAVYFKCTSKLVPTFKVIYGDLFKYEKNRAILFSLEEPIDEEALKSCMKCALQYHNIKHLPNLGLIKA